jgi:hypothetical protein
MTNSEKVIAITKILKLRFPNLTAEDVIKIAFDILDSIDK